MERSNTTRWQQFHLDDPRLAEISSSRCAERASNIFRDRRFRSILDLGCGTGRDSLRLLQSGAAVFGVDAARSGLELALRRAAGSEQSVVWVEALSQHLPFSAASFDGLYCFGLLHEFVGENAPMNVSLTMQEVRRVTRRGGLVVLAVLDGDPAAGLPDVRLFSEQMFAEAAAGFRCVEQSVFDDRGCTGTTKYKVRLGILENA